MAVIDILIIECAKSIDATKELLHHFVRFIDDGYGIWTGTQAQLELFKLKLNKIHPTIKFTFNYNFDTKSTVFLDTRVWIENGKIFTDLFRKPTDKVQYLLPSSAHPRHVSKNIPYSLALRIRRICSTNALCEIRFKELKEMLLSRQYRPKSIDSAIEKVKLIPRSQALQKVIKI